MPVADLLKTARSAAGDWLKSIEVFDVFTGGNLGDDKKSVALSLVYRDDERTLTDDEVNERNSLVIASLEQTFSAELRK